MEEKKTSGGSDLCNLVLQECERHRVCGLRQGEDGGQEPVHSGQSQREGSRHCQVPAPTPGF